MISDEDLKKMQDALKNAQPVKGDDFDYLLGRMKALHDRRIFLNDDYYNSQLADYCERLQEVED